MDSLVLYPNEIEKINIEFNVVYPEQKYLPGKLEVKEKNNTKLIVESVKNIITDTKQ